MFRFSVLFLVVCPLFADEAVKPRKEISLLRKTAPEIAIDASLNGKVKRLAQFRGKVVLLDFWAVWCGPCVGSFPHLRDLDESYREDGLEVVGVTAYQERFDFDTTSNKLKVVGEIKTDEEKGTFTVTGGLDRDRELKMLKNLLAHHELRFPMLVLSADEWKKTSATYGVQILPTTVLIDRLGVVRLVQHGTSEELFTELTGHIEKLLAER